MKQVVRPRLLLVALAAAVAAAIMPGTAYAVPPVNDNFADALPISGLPYNNTANLVEATMEPGEPTSTCNTVTKSVWYSYTPTETMSVTARFTGYNYYNTVFTVFTGSSLSDLNRVACDSYYPGPLTFRVSAGQTYYLQLGTSSSSTGSVSFSLDTAPAVQPEISYWPEDPFANELISFGDYTNDPGGSQIVSRVWDFGDGTVSSMSHSVYHQYAADGDYTVQLTVTTSDGRTGTTTEVVRVRTHDVSIDRFLVPESATAGQTRTVSAHLLNTRYDETARVELYRSSPSGFQLVGSLTQFTQARPNRTTEFSFNYTFTAEDATWGKVTFKAVATLVGARDALSGDNQVISTPTRVM